MGDESSDPFALRLRQQRRPVQAAAKKLHELVLGARVDEPSDSAHEHPDFARQRDVLGTQHRARHDPQCSRIAACTAGNRDRSL